MTFETENAAKTAHISVMQYILRNKLSGFQQSVEKPKLCPPNKEENFNILKEFSILRLACDVNPSIHTKSLERINGFSHSQWKRSRNRNHENHFELWTSIWEFIDFSRLHCNEHRNRCSKRILPEKPNAIFIPEANKKNNNKSLWFKASQTLKSKRTQSCVFHSLASDCFFPAFFLAVSF